MSTPVTRCAPRNVAPNTVNDYASTDAVFAPLVFGPVANCSQMVSLFSYRLGGGKRLRPEMPVGHFLLELLALPYLREWNNRR